MIGIEGRDVLDTLGQGHRGGARLPLQQQARIGLLQRQAFGRILLTPDSHFLVLPLAVRLWLVFLARRLSSVWNCISKSSPDAVRNVALRPA
nr:hypothetical protein [Ralstonia syzygii]